MKISIYFPEADKKDLNKVALELDNIGAIEIQEKEPFELGSPIVNEFVIALGSAGVIAGIVKVLHSYILRNKDNNVEIRKCDGTYISLKGYSPSQIEKVLKNIEDL
ncbi:hypothetical protein K7H09_24205 [Halomonas sp. IOP_14]|uniref:hypothetical protein n=1 Tax=Halomonas sp. IOP_14 TaxID=2873295 RepID=UPI001E3733E7|nr:hypothetical protein [Halomonas sp. IOP_14]MCD1589100.1 hypothetical protein [Halomonas sp. IOP_14]|tara:strand:+ start:492 stop:809 length:318 start_codon:yes stop_codon:yes gene_type:complete